MGNVSKTGKHLSEEHRRKIGLANKKYIGRKMTEEQRRNQSERNKIMGLKPPHPGFGKKHWNLKGGITPIYRQIRNSQEYKLWRTSVFKRDGYKCIWCGKTGRGLVADHIKPFALFPELRFAIDNGRTLCQKCHETTDTYKRNALKFKD